MNHQPTFPMQPEDLPRQKHNPSTRAHKSCPHCWTPNPDRLLRIDEVCRYVGLGKSTIYRNERLGVFPRSIPLLPRSRHKGWLQSDLDHWVQQRIDEVRTDVS